MSVSGKGDGDRCTNMWCGYCNGNAYDIKAMVCFGRSGEPERPRDSFGRSTAPPLRVTQHPVPLLSGFGGRLDAAPRVNSSGHPWYMPYFGFDLDLYNRLNQRLQFNRSQATCTLPVAQPQFKHKRTLIKNK